MREDRVSTRTHLLPRKETLHKPGTPAKGQAWGERYPVPRGRTAHLQADTAHWISYATEVSSLNNFVLGEGARNKEGEGIAVILQSV